MRNIYCLQLLFFLLPALLGGCKDRTENNISQIKTCKAATCHPSTPLRSYPPNKGKHRVHFRAGFTCENCHKGYLSRATHTDGKIDADNGEIIVFFDSQNPNAIWDNVSSQCSNISCHNGVQGSMDWYGENPDSCLICHKSGSAIDPVATNGTGENGKHFTHITGKSISCQNCHKDYPKMDTHMNGIFGRAEPGSIEYFGGTYSGQIVSGYYDGSSDMCGNISCHNNTSALWYSAGTADCAGCHVNGSAIDPLTTNGEGFLGKHTVHVSTKSIKCEVCHFEYKNQSGHMNGIYGKSEIDCIVNFNGIFPDPGGSTVNVANFNDSNGVCSVISCHGGSTADWYAVEPLFCAGCHAPGSFIDPLSTSGSGDKGKHSAHVTGKNIECEICHKDHRSKAIHMNGTYGKAEIVSIVNFSGIFPAVSGTSVMVTNFDDASGACANISCHSNTNASWYTSGTTDCIICHVSASSIDPVTTNGSGAGGKHTIHVQNLGYPCSMCHKDHNIKPAHMNGVYGIQESDLIVFFDSTNPSAFWNDSAKTCNSMNCHKQANWYTTGESCTACHASGNTAGAVDPLVTNGIGGYGKHLVHVRNNGLYCEKCHSAYKNSLSHRTGTLDTGDQSAQLVIFDSANASGTWINDSGANTGSCNNLSCHPAGSLDWYGPNTWTKPACSSCHKAQVGNRRQIFDSNGNGTGTGGDFNKKSHHVIDYSKVYAGSSDQIVTDSDCEVCHDMANHMSGDIRLKNYDNTSDVVIFNASDTASLEPFCLGCHDADGAGGNMKPFSSPNTLGDTNGRNQAGVKIELSWNKLQGHRRQGLTCVGNGTPGTGCHGFYNSSNGAGSINTHGSDNSGLLVNKMSLPVPVTGPSWDKTQYKLCDDCHNSFPSILSIDKLVNVAPGGNYLGGILIAWPVQNGFQGDGFHDFRAYNYDRQYNLHLLHLYDSTWRYRGVETSRLSCIACHNVHGVDGQSHFLWDEWHYTVEFDDGTEYARLGNANFSGPTYPENCVASCHWDGAYRYPRTNFNEAYAVSNISSGALGTNDIVTVYFSHATNGLSLISGTSDTGPDFGIDKALPLSSSHKWGSITAVWSNANKTLSITILSPDGANPVLIGDKFTLAPYEGCSSPEIIS